MRQRERAFARIRRERGLSRLWAADRIGISAGYLGQLERGQAPLSWPVAEAMCAAYGVDMTSLVRLSA